MPGKDLFDFSQYTVSIFAPEEWEDTKGDEVSADDAWDSMADKIQAFVQQLVTAIDSELVVEVEDTSE